MTTSSPEPLQKKQRKQRISSQPVAQSGVHTNPLSLSADAIQRAQQNPSALTGQDVLSLQHTMGNRAVSNLLQGRSRNVPAIQPKRKVGPARDRDEVQANQVAGEIAQRKSAADPLSAGGPAPAAVEQGIRSAHGGGSPLPSDMRTSMEGKLGMDLGGVRIHKDARADTLNRSISARAFTTGQDIFFKQGEYKPGGSEGRGLLAHELTHVAQQSGMSGNSVQRSALIQRFSDEDVKPEATTNWNTETVRVTKSAAGKVGGVYFPEDANGNKLVIKPEYNDNTDRPTTAGQSQFADTVLGKFGFSTPGSRILRSGEGEFNQLVQVLTSGRLQLSPKDAPDRDAIVARLGNVKYFKIMSMATGDSWDKTFEDSVLSKDNADKLIAFLQANNYAFARNTGKLIVADTLIGNDDRINFDFKTWKKFGINGGNVIFSGEQMMLIDNDSSLGDLLQKTGSNTGAFKSNKVTRDQMTALFEHMDQFALTFVTKYIPDYLKGEYYYLDKSKLDGFNGVTYISAWCEENKDALVQAMKDGVQSGMTTLSELFSNQETMGNLRGVTKTYGEGEEDRLWTAFETRGRHMMARQDGRDKNLALMESQLYYESTVTGGQGYAPVEDVDPDALELEKPKKKSKFSLKRAFGKRKKSRQLRARARNAMTSENNLNELNYRNIETEDNYYHSKLANKVLDKEEFKPNRKDRAGREIKFLHGSGILVRELNKKVSEVEEHVKVLNATADYLRHPGAKPREHEMAQKRIQAYVDGNVLSKLQEQSRKLVASAERAVPNLTKHTPDLAALIRTTSQKLHSLVTLELVPAYTNAWNALEESKKILVL